MSWWCNMTEIVSEKCWTHPLDLLGLRFARRRRRGGRRGRRSIRRPRGQCRACPKGRCRPIIVNNVGHYGLPQNWISSALSLLKSDATICCFKSRVMFLGSLWISRHVFEAQIGLRERAHTTCWSLTPDTRTHSSQTRGFLWAYTPPSSLSSVT